MIRSIVGAFDDDGVLLHNGGERVVAHARDRPRDQVIGTGIRHDLHRHHRCMAASAVIHVASCVIEATFAAPLIARLRFPRRGALTVSTAVNLPAIIRLAKVHDLPAASAANPHENRHLHARTSKAAFIEVARACALRHLRPVSVHARHEGSGLYTGAFIHFAVLDRLRDRDRHRHFPADLLRFLRI